MPSFSHEFLIALFRDAPELAPYLLTHVLGIELPPYTEIRIEETNFTVLRPTEYRADLVLTLRNGAAVLGIIIEVQLQVDPRKEYSWAVYACELRARLQGEVVVLVVSDSEQVVRWASQPIKLGGRSVFQVEVLGSERVPRVETAELARRLPELAVLSALTHGNGPGGTEVLVPTLEALLTLDPERQGFYYDVVLRSLNEATRRALQEELMQSGKYEYQSDFARTYLAKGRAEGEAKGRSEGLAAGRAEGLAAGRAEALLVVLAARRMEVDASTRERILGCADATLLERWIARATTASSLSEVFETP
ncbi:MAG TPA: hypothetical protein VH877_12585 [Polyangia bacterium]|jgi:hypothetical protein|nr:hypothetical protein [Polyangia bacterium]